MSSICILRFTVTTRLLRHLQTNHLVCKLYYYTNSVTSRSRTRNDCQTMTEKYRTWKLYVAYGRIVPDRKTLRGSFSPTQSWELERLVPQSTPQYNRPFCVLFQSAFFVKAPFWCFFRSAFLVLIRFLYETIYTLKLVYDCCLANCFFPTSHCCIVENKIGIWLWRRISQNRYIETPTVLYRHT